MKKDNTFEWNETIQKMQKENIKYHKNDKCSAHYISGEALELIQDFIKYAELDMEAMADLMYYDYEGFKWKLSKLKKQIGEQ